MNREERGPKLRLGMNLAPARSGWKSLRFLLNAAALVDREEHQQVGADRVDASRASAADRNLNDRVPADARLLDAGDSAPCWPRSHRDDVALDEEVIGCCAEEHRKIV